MPRLPLPLLCSLILLSACSDDDASSSDTREASESTTGDGDGDPATGDGDGDPSTGDGDGDDPTTGDGDGDPTTGDGDGDPGPLSFTVVTFNTGTTDGLPHDSDGDGYGEDQAQTSNDFYGDGLAWLEAVFAAQAWLADTQPDIIAFQEIFYSEECAQIPPEQHPGFVCSTWMPGDPTVAALILGEGYQIACHQGKDDKCVAVRLEFGSFVGCEDTLCMDFLDGAQIQDCGGGSRVGRGRIELASGEDTITVVSVHGTSGISPEDSQCRIQQIDQIFVDLDGEPAANGTRNIILGDLNTDPYRVPELIDPSVERWLDFVDQLGGDKDFWWVSEAGEDAPPSYTGGLNIDHIISDSFDGPCQIAGVQGVPAVYPNVYFDHKPHLCTVVEFAG